MTYQVSPTFCRIPSFNRVFDFPNLKEASTAFFDMCKILIPQIAYLYEYESYYRVEIGTGELDDTTWPYEEVNYNNCLLSGSFDERELFYEKVCTKILYHFAGPDINEFTAKEYINDFFIKARNSLRIPIGVIEPPLKDN